MEWARLVHALTTTAHCTSRQLLQLQHSSEEEDGEEDAAWRKQDSDATGFRHLDDAYDGELNGQESTAQGTIHVNAADGDGGEDDKQGSGCSGESEESPPPLQPPPLQQLANQHPQHHSNKQQQQQLLLQEEEEDESPTSVLQLRDEEQQCSSSSSSNASNGGSRRARWAAMNRLLADCGFPPVRLPLREEQLYQILLTILRDFGRRESLVQELLQDGAEQRRKAEESNAQAGKLEEQLQLCERRMAMVEQRADMAMCSAERANAGLRKDVHGLEAANSNLQQRCSQLEHKCRAKERAAEKYQSKLLQALQKEESQRCRDMEVCRSFKKKVMNRTGEASADLKPAQQLVSVYEKQKAALAAEVCALRAQVGKLCQELQGKENMILGGLTSGSGKHRSVDSTLLAHLCKKLDVSSPLQLPTALDALLAVNAAVPLLEDFVDDVCNVVLISGKEFVPKSKTDNPREVANILKGWVDKFAALMPKDWP